MAKTKAFRVGLELRTMAIKRNGKSTEKGSFNSDEEEPDLATQAEFSVSGS